MMLLAGGTLTAISLSGKEHLLVGILGGVTEERQFTNRTPLSEFTHHWGVYEKIGFRLEPKVSEGIHYYICAGRWGILFFAEPGQD